MIRGLWARSFPNRSFECFNCIILAERLQRGIFLQLRGLCSKSCAQGVCVGYVDIDSMRKLAVQFGIWQGWQAGHLLKEMDSFSVPLFGLVPIDSPCFA